MKNLGSLSFSHDFVDSFSEPLYSLVLPSKVSEPRLVAWSENLAARFNLSHPGERGANVDLLTGNLILPDMKPFAVCYGGHQFGRWAGQLGDGRAITLGEVRDIENQPWEFQLKGAGPTPYSRGADGRAVLRSSIREFICSEAMYHLGVPSTRALSVTVTGDQVMRDMFYDGNPRNEPGAVVCRVSPSFVRFGNFEILAARQDTEGLRKLIDFVRARYFSKTQETSVESDLEWFREVCRRTAWMVAQWMRVGFVHGVMNTDNMSILGLTIDYGPYGWLDNFDPSWTPNTTDLPGRRYCYGRQPGIAQWNLAMLAQALMVLHPHQEKVWQHALEDFESFYSEYFLQMMAQKLGLSKLETSDDIQFLAEMDALLQSEETDMTLFFRGLSGYMLTADQKQNEDLPIFLKQALYKDSVSQDLVQRWGSWLQIYRERLVGQALNPEVLAQRMNQANPIYVPRNYLLHQAITAAENGDFSEVKKLLHVFENPYREQVGQQSYAQKRPDWARHQPGCSTLSCSS